MSHHHKCQCCRTVSVPCDDTWERNHDGVPEVICQSYHVQYREYLCDGCRARMAADLEAQEREATPWAV